MKIEYMNHAYLVKFKTRQYGISVVVYAENEEEAEMKVLSNEDFRNCFGVINFAKAEYLEQFTILSTKLQ